MSSLPSTPSLAPPLTISPTTVCPITTTTTTATAEQPISDRMDGSHTCYTEVIDDSTSLSVSQQCDTEDQKRSGASLVNNAEQKSRDQLQRENDMVYFDLQNMIGQVHLQLKDYKIAHGLVLISNSLAMIKMKNLETYKPWLESLSDLLLDCQEEHDHQKIEELILHIHLTLKTLQYISPVCTSVLVTPGNYDYEGSVFVHHHSEQHVMTTDRNGYLYVDCSKYPRPLTHVVLERNTVWIDFEPVQPLSRKN